MTRATLGRRPYGAADLEELMSRVAGWAQGWDDLLRFIQGTARHETLFSRRALAGLADDSFYRSSSRARCSSARGASVAARASSALACDEE